MPWVKQPLLDRLRQSDAHLRLTLACGKLIHDAGGSVTIESTPDSRDSTSTWFLSMGGYDSSTQHPLWEDPLMKEYMVYTESELVTRPMCAAGSPYRAFRTICMNKRASAGSKEYRALACVHRSHTQMRGRDANGVWHGEHAERYTSEWCGVLDRIHETAGGGDSGSDSSSDSDSGSDSSQSASDSDSDSDGDGNDVKPESGTTAQQQQRPKQQPRQQTPMQLSQQATLALAAGNGEPASVDAREITRSTQSESSRLMNSKILVRRQASGKG
jgi:hypothetical protein